MRHFSIGLEPVSSALQMEAALSSETPISTYNITQCQHPDHYSLDSPCSDNLET